jgi:hypothetical protein
MGNICALYQGAVELQPGDEAEQQQQQGWPDTHEDVIGTEMEDITIITKIVTA